MDFTAKVALMTGYYPFQLRVNSILLANNVLTPGVVYMTGFASLCNETCLQEPVRGVIVAQDPFDPVVCYTVITDAHLTTSVMAAYDKLKDVLNPPFPPPYPTGNTGT